MKTPGRQIEERFEDNTGDVMTARVIVANRSGSGMAVSPA
jgi:hypothetical protein